MITCHEAGYKNPLEVLEAERRGIRRQEPPQGGHDKV